MMRSAILANLLLLFVLLLASSAQAQTAYSLALGSGSQSQIGTGLPLPVQVFAGGTMTATAGTAFWPPLLGVPQVGPSPPVTETGPSGTLRVNPGVIGRVATAVAIQPTFPTNPAVFQVNTAIDSFWPAATATFAPGQGPAALALTPGAPVTITSTVGGTVTYSNTGRAFGGAGGFSFSPSPLAADGLIAGAAVTVYINFMGSVPGTLPVAAAIVPVFTLLPQSGAGFVGSVTPAPQISTAGANTTPGFVAGIFGPLGTAISTAFTANGFPGLTNRIIGDQGFPWTTGMLTVAAPAVPPETFFLSGTDTRVGGVGAGNVSMVAGTLSNRQLSGPNANRSWVRMLLPEPGAMAAAAGALLTLGACHNWVRRRR